MVADGVRAELAPKGVLRAAINLGNGAEQITFRDTVALSPSNRFIRVRALKP